jgi:SAM-dependent methyltransferase
MASDETVRHGFWPEAWLEFDGLFDWLCNQPTVAKVCEVGGGANPALSLDFIVERGLDHALIDVSKAELAKAPSGYRKIVADIADPAFAIDESFDLVVSAFLAEHVARPATFHANILRILPPGGFALHLFPTLYALPFLVNRVLPESITERILLRLQGFRQAEGNAGKFKAYYRWCRGPGRHQIRRLRDSGFDVVSYTGYFGHGYYRHFPVLDRAEDRKARFLVKHPQSALTSYALVLLRRRGGERGDSLRIPARPRSDAVVSESSRSHRGSGWN